MYPPPMDPCRSASPLTYDGIFPGICAIARKGLCIGIFSAVYAVDECWRVYHRNRRSIPENTPRECAQKEILQGGGEAMRCTALAVSPSPCKYYLLTRAISGTDAHPLRPRRNHCVHRAKMR